MKGSIKKDKKTGRYFYVIDMGIDPLTGKRTQKKKRGFNTKKEAEHALSEFLNDVRLGNYVEPDKMTLSDFIQDWLKEMKLNVAVSTYQNYISFNKCHINPRLGHFRMQKIEPLIVQRFIYDLVEETALSSNTIKKIIDMLKVVFRKAVSLKLVNENPVLNVTLPKRKNLEMTAWDTEQVEYFIQHSKKHRFYTVYLIALLTGMRKGEITGLRWKDIDFEQKIIYIRQIYDINAKQFKVGAKTSAGVRSIHIPDVLIEQLKKERLVVVGHKLKQGPNFNDYDLVVCTRYGNPLDSATLSKRLKAQAIKLGLPTIRFHDLRHTHVTMLIKQNVNVKVISERVGHTSIQITLDKYSHVLPSMQKHVADELDNLFKSKEM
ncbi:site-specific integrase [Peribacillus frigoritolerans]|uniref:site-specific integrase n=1 Tax=Peribacillus frigoritolerans TaxID=450367 RepID=UPI00256FA858|nr:site-specific integrase [Peribacillus frigoritolerans]WJE48936.1 site-specific integrase [Peribacillus frigoritolerans]